MSAYSTLNFAIFSENTIQPEITILDQMLRNCESIKISVINILSTYTAAAKKGKSLLAKY